MIFDTLDMIFCGSSHEAKTVNDLGISSMIGKILQDAPAADEYMMREIKCFCGSFFPFLGLERQRPWREGIAAS